MPTKLIFFFFQSNKSYKHSSVEWWLARLACGFQVVVSKFDSKLLIGVNICFVSALACDESKGVPRLSPIVGCNRHQLTGDPYEEK